MDTSKVLRVTVLLGGSTDISLPLTYHSSSCYQFAYRKVLKRTRWMNYGRVLGWERSPRLWKLNTWYSVGSTVWGDYRSCSLVRGRTPLDGRLWEFRSLLYFQLALNILKIFLMGEKEAQIRCFYRVPKMQWKIAKCVTCIIFLKNANSVGMCHGLTLAGVHWSDGKELI